jgi:hypothetical protein
MTHMSDKKSYSTQEPNQEDSREHEKASHQRGAQLAFTQVSRPHPRSGDQGGFHLSVFFASRFSTALGFSSLPLIQVGLIRELWCIPLISGTLPPGSDHPQSWVETLSLLYNQETLDRMKGQAFKRILVL